jgi:hypothetical protein
MTPYCSRVAQSCKCGDVGISYHDLVMNWAERLAAAVFYTFHHRAHASTPHYRTQKPANLAVRGRSTDRKKVLSPYARPFVHDGDGRGSDAAASGKHKSAEWSDGSRDMLSGANAFEISAIQEAKLSVVPRQNIVHLQNE